MSFVRLRLLIFLLAFCSIAEAQVNYTDSIPEIRLLTMNSRTYQSHDTIWIYSGVCKILKVTMLTGQPTLVSGPGKPSETKTPFLTIHGNIQYDYLYRSFADTPFYQKDFRQHTVQTSLTVTVKNKYPFRVNLVVRKSNSPFFKNFFDGGILFDRYNYYKNLRQQLLTRISKQMPDLSYLDAAKALLEKKMQQYNALKARLSTNGLAQRLIEEREKKYFESLQLPGGIKPGIPGIDKQGIDTVVENIRELVNDKRKELDSLQNSIDQLRFKVDSMKNKLAGSMATVVQKINKATHPRELMKISAEYGLEEKKKKWEDVISNIRTIGIGRSVLNYSELTARNVLLTGLNVEYNPRLYVAVAAGKIDYGFRDFFGRNSRALNQHLLLGRIGLGDIDKKAIIFSLYTGRKAGYGSLSQDTASGSILMTGYSIEGIIKKDANTSFSAEIAKSTRPVTGRYNDNKALGSLFRFGDETNLALSVKGQTIIAETKTRLSGLFRKTGENYQSFSLFSYNTDQTAWMIKAEQSFLKDKVSFTGMLRRNDFVNPFTEKTFKTTTVFGSAQLSVRFRKWPALNLGYYPGSQLYIIDRNRVRENVYYIFNGSLVHQYKLAGLQLTSSAIYNNYTNKGTDSGFINYSGKTYMLSQSAGGRKLQIQGNFIYTDQQELRFYTLESTADYAIGDILRLGAGLKYNKIIDGKTYWGGTGQLLIDIKKTGSLQLQYERSFLPTIQQTLFPVEMGRLTWYKTF